MTFQHFPRCESRHQGTSPHQVRAQHSKHVPKLVGRSPDHKLPPVCHRAHHAKFTMEICYKKREPLDAWSLMMVNRLSMSGSKGESNFSLYLKTRLCFWPLFVDNNRQCHCQHDWECRCKWLPSYSMSPRPAQPGFRMLVLGRHLGLRMLDIFSTLLSWLQETCKSSLLASQPPNMNMSENYWPVADWMSGRPFLSYCHMDRLTDITLFVSTINFLHRSIHR